MHSNARPAFEFPPAHVLVVVVLGLLGSIGCGGSEPRISHEPPITVFLVRHAEKTDAGTNPDLSDVGRARAQLLLETLRHQQITHLYASEFQRTQRTLQPLAVHFGLDVEVVPARDAATLVQELRGLPAGSTAVVAGHSNTVPSLVAHLAGENDAQQLQEDEYDRLFVVLLQRGGLSIRTLQLRYGD